MLQASEGDRWFVTECAMGAHKVIEGYEESGKGNNAVKVFEAGPRPGMEFIGAVEALNQLLEHAISFAFWVEVLQADHGVFRE